MPFHTFVHIFVIILLKSFTLDVVFFRFLSCLNDELIIVQVDELEKSLHFLVVDTEIVESCDLDSLTLRKIVI